MSKIQHRSDVVTIYQGDTLSRLRHLERQYDEAIKAEGQTPLLASEVPESESLLEEHKALKVQAEKTALHVDVFALGRRRYRELVKENPPRKDNDEDQALGVNEDDFKDALVPMSIVYPLDHEKAGEEQLSEDDLDSLSDIDFDRLYYTAFALNRMPSADPKALERPDSRTNTKSDES